MQLFLPNFQTPPIGNSEFISISNDGHFQKGGERITFWANNICDAQVFPEKQYAASIVGHIKKMGYNLMRFHYIDGYWGNDPHIFTHGSSTRSLDPGNLDKMEYLINEFKKNGVYVNMNLNVARRFNTLDGVPDADSLKDFAKSVTLFDPYLIMLQKEYAQQLFTHVNPYTGLPLVNDPVMAMVEITNENWFLHNWQANSLRPIYMGGNLTVRHNNMLQQLWNDYLLKRYGSNDALKLTWQSGSFLTEEQLQNGGFEDGVADPFQFNSWDANTQATGAIDNDAASGNNFYKVSIVNAAANTWDVQLIQQNLTIEKDSSYIVTFKAKSSKVQEGQFSLQTYEGDFYYHVGYNIALTTDWQNYEWRFTGRETSDGIVELMFQFGHNTGDIWLDDISFRKEPIPGLLEGESLVQKNIKRMYRDEIDNFSSKRVRTLFEFFVDLQIDYYKDMYSYLKNELGVKVPISGSNWHAGFADLKIQSEMDYIDSHSYWDHPSNDRINNEPMVTHSNWNTITESFAVRVVDGKPFTISEYNHCYPNKYQVEAPFFFAAYGAYHDADALMMFGYSEGTSLGEGWEPDMILSNFDVGRQNVLSSFMPTFGYAFRNRLISGANSQVNVNLSSDDIYDAFLDNGGFYMYPADYPYKLALTKKMRITDFESSQDLDISTFPAISSSPYKTDTGELTWDENGLFKIETDKLVGFTGFLNNYTGAQIGNLKIVNADKFAGVTLLSLDDKSLTRSERLLLTVGTRQLNSNTQWTDNYHMLSNKGDEPTIIEPTKITLEVTMEADSIVVHRLNSLGGLSGSSTTYYPVTQNKFRITIDQNIEKSLWYGIEASLNNTPVVAENELVNGDFSNGLNNWYTFINSSASAEVKVEDGILLYNISNGGISGWEVQLLQGNIPVEKGKTYFLHFDAAAENSRTISVGVSEDGGNFSSYGDNSFSLSSEMKTYDFTFTMQHDTDNSARFFFDLGGSDADVRIDNVYFGELISTDIDDGDEMPTEFALEQNYPNPFNPSTRIRYSLQKSGNIKLTVYDILGREIETLVNGYMSAGKHEINFDASELSSGIYFYTLQTGEFSQTRKMILLR